MRLHDSTATSAIINRSVVAVCVACTLRTFPLGCELIGDSRRTLPLSQKNKKENRHKSIHHARAGQRLGAALEQLDFSATALID
jgi:hypothetical protein